MKRFAAALVLVACSNAAKPHDAAPPTPPVPHVAPPTAASARVFIEGPSGELPVDVEVVSTEAAIQRGLMFREFMPANGGMLFIMEEEKVQTFWMRNTLIPLDMIFITRDLTIAGIVEKAEPKTDTIRSVGKTSLYVLEVNGGWAAAQHITAGAKVRFDGVLR